MRNTVTSPSKRTRHIGDPFWSDLLTGKKQADATIQVVTPDQARRWLDEFNFENQRPRKEFDVAKLATVIHRDEFALCTLIFYIWNGRPYLVDGQHRLEACITADTPIEVVVGCKVVDSYEQVRNAYASCDNHKPRTVGVRVAATSMPDETCMSVAQCTRLLSAVHFILNEFRGKCIRATDPERANFGYLREKATEWKEEGKDYFEAVWQCPSGMISRWTRGSVFSVGLMILRHQPEKAYAFLQTAANDSALVRGTPEWALARVQRDYDSKEVGADRLSRLVAACWNAHYDGRQITDPAKGIPLDVSSAPPIVIRGTPFNGE